MEKVSYKELTIGFLVIVSFFMSVAVGYISYNVTSMEDRMDYIEQKINLK